MTAMIVVLIFGVNVAACIFIVAVSLATSAPAPEKEVLDEFDLASGK